VKILEYVGLDTSRVKAQYARLRDAIERDDFRQAEVKKLANVSHGKFYRAKLDYANRLLFSILRHGEVTYALMLEVIEQHAYDRSRFLRGATIDEEKIPPIDAAAAAGEAVPARYIHPDRRDIHLLDKVISFDDAQETVYRLPPPLIVVGSAGSGKTALTLEKLKHTEGEVLYVTHSAYLARSARDLYYGHGFEHGGQDANFLAYREFLESLRVPPGRAAEWRDFTAWFARQQQAFKGIDAHQAFEEIRGVITADEGGPLTRGQYLALGVRQSIFAAADRERLYDLYERYRAWLGEAGLYDRNLVAHEWHRYAVPRYDFVVVDEVQDLTMVQLALVLATLKRPGHFLLCGDSNQIVHPNFFSWSRVKSLFWRDEALAQKQELKVLRANFRNGGEATRVANALLKIKHRRFGSIDRESNFLVDAVAGEGGIVTVLPDTDATKKELNHKTRQSTQFAVLVMRDDDKLEARRYFQTPLIFSIHEAKGLEYENIVLYRFVSGNRVQFAEIVAGVAAADLNGDDLDYRRAKDKADKSLEIYKFYVNALYVALTRAIRNLYLIEADTRHPLLRLLDVRQGSGEVKVDAAASTRDDWQKEARKLELQGKQEQAKAIRQSILKEAPVPWPVFDEARLCDTLAKVFREHLPGGKAKQQLYEYAACYGEPVLAEWLASEANFRIAGPVEHQRTTLGRKHFAAYFSPHLKDVLQLCDRHGIDHRTPMNQTPLIAAAAAGNVALVEALLARGANPERTDHLGRNPLHWALLEAFHDEKFARGPFAALYELIAPAAIDVMSGERLVRIDRHLSEYLLFQTLWALFKSRFTGYFWDEIGGFQTAAILDAWQHLPPSVLRPERNKRQHLSHLLSRNEVERDYAYNRRLFVRVAHGWYQFNPALSVRRRNASGEAWLPICDALNLRFVAECADPQHWAHIDALLGMAGQPPMTTPIAGERIARQLAAERKQQETVRRKMEALRQQVEVTEQAPVAAPPPRWGTKEARRLEVERIRREIAENTAKRARDGEPIE
jgi:Ankyrin repeats (3 copies)/Viral (Superfamily 1) RNA helicase